MDATEYAQQTLATIQMLEGEIERLKAQIERAKETIQTTALRGLQETDGSACQDLMWELYWKHNDTVSAWVLAEFLNVRVNVVRNHIACAYLYVPCKKCGKQFHAQIASRAEYKAAIAGYEQDDDWRQKCCPDCEAEEQNLRQHRSQEYQENVRQREARINELRTMPYREYLLTPEWKATREYKLKRARYRCELCFKQGKLNVHHKTYERRGNEDDRDLIVLCEDCHAKFHDKLVEG